MPRKPSRRVPAGSFTNTSPETWRTIVFTPATGGTLPAGSCSQALPTPSASPSAWSLLATAGQLSAGSGAAVAVVGVGPSTT